MWEQKKTAAGARPGVADYVRQVRAMGAAIDDPDALFQADQVIEAAEVAFGSAVVRLLTEDGYSWADIGRPFGISRQAARERWNKWLPEVLECGCQTWSVLRTGHRDECPKL